MKTRKKGRSEGEEKNQEETYYMEQIHRGAVEIRRQLREENGSTGNRERMSRMNRWKQTRKKIKKVS